MVLTGTQISGKDAIELGVADRLLIHKDYENELSHIVQELNPMYMITAEQSANKVGER